MLQFIKDLPDHVVGIRAMGEVNKEDYEKVLIPRMEELVRRQGEIDYLLVLETDVQNFSAAAWFEDLKLGLKNFTKWRKIAIVTDQKSVIWFSDMFSHFIPGQARGFHLTELEHAINWVSDEGDFEHSEISIDEIKEANAERSSNVNQGPATEDL